MGRGYSFRVRFNYVISSPVHQETSSDNISSFISKTEAVYLDGYNGINYIYLYKYTIKEHKDEKEVFILTDCHHNGSIS